MVLTDPTSIGFLHFVRDQAGIPVSALPDDSTSLTYAYDTALALVNRDLMLAGINPIYGLAVYNLATSLLINYATDIPPSTYFKDLRAKWNLSSFTPGVISSSSDSSTSQSFAIPNSLQNLTIADLQRLKDPWGRQYLEFAQFAGQSVWGLS